MPWSSEPLLYWSLQAVQNRLFNDHAAIYYLLLRKLEMGRLHVPSPTLKPHPRLSVGGVPPIIPQISIQNTDSPPSSSPPERNPFNNIPTSIKESEEEMKDLNLARYLQGGRRHTLGATQNTSLITPEQLQRLRESSELSSSKTGSIMTNSVMNRLGGMQLDSTNLQALSFGTGMNHSSQSSMAPGHRHIQPSRPRMNRRVSDGGPYLKAYQKYFMEKRSPNLQQINSSNALNQQSSMVDVDWAGSMKALLQRSKGLQGDQRQWLPQNSHVSSCMCVYGSATSCTYVLCDLSLNSIMVSGAASVLLSLCDVLWIKQLWFRYRASNTNSGIGV